MISVIVPIYNVEDYLIFCINSILQQTHKDFELLLIDDGSTDNSGKICDDFADHDTRCKTIHQENQGEAGARNTGLDIAKGEYIAFIDADDYVHPQYLEILYKTICENKCEISVVDYENFQNMYYDTLDYIGKGYETRSLLQKDLMAALFSKTSFMTVWGKLYKREILQCFRFKSFYIAEDVEFNSRVYQTAQKAVVADVKLYYWMNRSSSISRVLFSQRNIDAIDCYKFALDNIHKNRTMYRAHALQRLYKVILYTRYNVTLEFKTAVKSKVSPIVGCTILEFLLNRYIPMAPKTSLLIFYYIPFLYHIFRWGLEKRAKIKYR